MTAIFYRSQLTRLMAAEKSHRQLIDNLLLICRLIVLPLCGGNVFWQPSSLASSSSFASSDCLFTATEMNPPLLKTMVLFQLLINTFFDFHKLRGVAALGEQVYQPVPSEIDRFKMIQEKIHQAENQEQNNLVVEEDQHRPSEADEGGGGDLARHHPFLNHHQQQQPPPQLQPHLYHHPHPFLSHLLQRLTGAAATLHQPTFVMSHPPPPASQSMMQQQQQQQLEPPSPLPPAQHHLEQSIPPSSPPSLIAASNQQQHFPVLPQFPQVSPTIHHQLAAAQPHQVGGIVGDPLEGIHSGGQQQQLQLQQSVAGSSLSSAPHLHPETYQTLMQKNLVLPGEVPPSSIDKHHLETMNSGGGGGGDEHVGMETKGDGKLADNPDDDSISDSNFDFNFDFYFHLTEKDRDDRGRGDQHRGNSHHGGGGSLLAPRRCYACSWSIAQCADFNCYNNPDICTNNHFRAHKVQQEDCPSGCEQYVVTDPNGLIQMWKRGCAPRKF